MRFIALGGMHLRQRQQLRPVLGRRLLEPALHKVDQDVRGHRPLQLAVDVVPGLPGTCTDTQNSNPFRTPRGEECVLGAQIRVQQILDAFEALP